MFWIEFTWKLSCVILQKKFPSYHISYLPHRSLSLISAGEFFSKRPESLSLRFSLYIGLTGGLRIKFFVFPFSDAFRKTRKISLRDYVFILLVLKIKTWDGEFEIKKCEMFTYLVFYKMLRRFFFSPGGYMYVYIT